jgi:hypothetical protein
VQQLTTGVKEDVPEYMVAALFELLDDDQSGFVSKSELFTYVSSVGLVIDLNGKPRGSASEKPKERALAKLTTVAGLMPASATKPFSISVLALDLSNAERVIAELRERDKTASSALRAEIARSHSKVTTDLSAAVAHASPEVVPRVSLRMAELHQVSGHLPRNSSVKSLGRNSSSSLADADSPPRKSEATYTLDVPAARTSEAKSARTSEVDVPPPVAEAPEGGDEAV